VSKSLHILIFLLQKLFTSLFFKPVLVIIVVSIGLLVPRLQVTLIIQVIIIRARDHHHQAGVLD